MGKIMIKVIASDPFQFGRLYGDEKYCLNDMEIANTGFPSEVEDGNITSVWSDRIQDEWYKAKDEVGLLSMQTGDAWYAGVPNDQLLKFGAAVARFIGFKAEVTAVRIVRFTHGMSQYPVLRLDLASGGRGRSIKKQPRHEFYYDDPMRFENR